METSDFLSSAPPDRVLFVCWIPRADLFDLKDGDYLQVSRIDDLLSSRRQPLADLVRPSTEEKTLVYDSDPEVALLQARQNRKPINITLAGLASSPNIRQGRSSAVIPNDEEYGRVRLELSVTVGDSPLAGSSIALYWVQKGRNGYTGEDAAYDLPPSALPFACLHVTSSQGGAIYRGTFHLTHPGKDWGVVVAHNTGCALDLDPEKHYIRFLGDPA